MKDSDIMFEPHTSENKPQYITSIISTSFKKGLFLMENLSVYLYLCVCLRVCVWNMFDSVSEWAGNTPMRSQKQVT